MKTEICEAKGYRLIHVWEDEWINNNQQIKNDIKKLFNNDYLISLHRNEKAKVQFDIGSDAYDGSGHRPGPGQDLHQEGPYG